MKFRYLLSAAAAAMLLIGGATFQPANAAPTSGHRAWCATSPIMSKMSCRYNTLAKCKKFVKASNGSCVRNPNMAKGKSRSTTGMR